jgi:cation transport ATPase
MNHEHAVVTPSAAAKYFCPMCPGVESDKPGDCPKCGMVLERNPVWKPAQKIIYTCPMHPQIEQDHPGNCPICGMALEPKGIPTAAGEDQELIDMSRRFWIGLALAVPVFVLAMGEMLLSGILTPHISQWIQLALSTPVVWWAGWPFFVRGWTSIRTWNLNMFTLVALGVGTAWTYSVLALLAADHFPRAYLDHGVVPVYFEAGAVITVLVLLGQVLELRARGRTSMALRALLDQAPKTARRVRGDQEEETLAASLEHQSEHPLARSIMLAAEARGIHLLPVDRFESIPGNGVIGQIDGKTIRIGKAGWLATAGVANEPQWETEATKLREQGQSVILVAVNQSMLALIGVADSVKTGATEAVQELHRLGIRIVMATGDNAQTAAIPALRLAALRAQEPRRLRIVRLGDQQGLGLPGREDRAWS